MRPIKGGQIGNVGWCVPALITCAWLAACGGNSPTSPTQPGGNAGPAVLVGAGDIALCDASLPDAEATAKLLDGISGTVFTAGDNVQGVGAEQEFRDCYDPTWGRHKARTRPTPGNHDYLTANAQPYFDYFGANAGPPGLGYYSYDLGAWHILSLNSNIAMTPGSPQAVWLQQDLATHRTPCSLAYWHHPLVSSAQNGDNPSVRDLWRPLYEAGVEVVFNGHDHVYERFAPQDPDGRADPARGIRQFTVGTGGWFLYQLVKLTPNSEVQARVHGVLKLNLRSDGYDWQFIPVAGTSFSDSGSGACH